MAEATVNGVRLAYDVHGTGDPVVLVCGTGQPAMSWLAYQVPALTAAGYQVVTFDNRGVPPSDAPTGPYSVRGMADKVAGPSFATGVGLIKWGAKLATPSHASDGVGAASLQDAYQKTLRWLRDFF